MKVEELAKALNLDVVAGKDGITNELRGCYIGDLMSMAMSSLDEGNVWITIQTNINVIAVATLKEAACVILAEGYSLDDNAVAKADAEKIPVLSSENSAYELALQLGEMKI